MSVVYLFFVCNKYMYVCVCVFVRIKSQELYKQWNSLLEWYTKNHAFGMFFNHVNHMIRYTS